MTFPDFPRLELPSPVPPIHGEASPPPDDAGESEAGFAVACRDDEVCDGVRVACISAEVLSMPSVCDRSVTVCWNEATAGLRGSEGLREYSGLLGLGVSKGVKSVMVTCGKCS